MAASTPPPSFTPHRKWGAAFQVGLVSLLVLAVVVMLNYLSQDFFYRWHWSSRTRIQLSPRTLHLLQALTNQVRVTVYYDKQNDELYSTVTDLLNEYHQVNPRITVQVIDYLLNPGQAQKVMTEYRERLAIGTEKNLVIFDCEGRAKVLDGAALAQYGIEQLPSNQDAKLRAKPVLFLGELAFTAALLEVVNPKPLHAYFLQGHQEHAIDSGDALMGYLLFASVVQQQNSVRVHPLSLLGPNPVPGDCSLLVIAGPRQALTPPELAKLDQYLTQGGRLLVLFNSGAIDRPTGLEALLAKWGVGVGANVVVDPGHSQTGADVIVGAFSKHPVVNPLLKAGLYLIQPRTISKLGPQTPEAPQVEELAKSSPGAFILGDEKRRGSYPLMVAVETPRVKGVVRERGNTRILVVGDSLFLCNNQINSLGNRDFANYALNWLLDRTELLEGVGPQPIREYRLIMTRNQLQRAQWLLLGGLPAGALFIGGLVWLRRRR